MPAYPRCHIVVSDTVGVYHCIARCVRRAFLCGIDPITGKDHDHRKEWIRERLETLASIFAIDICSYAVMSNHLHVVLRVRPDLVQTWTDEEVGFRHLRLYPPRDPATGKPVGPSEHDLNAIVSDRARVDELRARLASLSWFMRCLSEPIARRANREDGCTGRFWEGRFKSQALLDEAAILACSVYVDLNPVRAGVAEAPENSVYTSAFDRIESERSTIPACDHGETLMPIDPPSCESVDPPDPPERRRRDEWLCELTLEDGQRADAHMNPSDAEFDQQLVVDPNPDQADDGRGRIERDLPARASNQGYLPITLGKYLAILDWTGRQVRAKGRATISADLAPILTRLGVNGDEWVDTVRNFGRRFKRAIGRRAALQDLAARLGQAWFQGQRAASTAFR